VCVERSLDAGHRAGGDGCRPVPPSRSPRVGLRKLRSGDPLIAIKVVTRLTRLLLIFMDYIVQINLNGQVGSNDLILQLMRKRYITHSVPDDPGWIISPDGSAAITWRGWERAVDCAPVATEMGFCVVRWGEIFVCSCYFSPNQATREFVK